MRSSTRGHGSPPAPGSVPPRYEHGTAGLDRADPDRAQVVEDGIGRRHAVGPRRARHRGHRPHAASSASMATAPPCRIPTGCATGRRAPSGSPVPRRARSRRIRRGRRVHLRRRHGHHDGALELEDHRPGVEDGARHGGGGHGPAGGPLVDDVDGRDHRGAAAPDHVDPEPERADLAQLGHGDSSDVVTIHRGSTARPLVNPPSESRW